VVEYNKILKNSQPQLYDYFNFAKSIWSIVYDSIDVVVKKNKNNLQSKSGFFTYKTPEKLYVWQYTTRRIYKTNGQTKTSLKLIYEGDQNNLTISEIISKFSKTYEKNNESTYPVFEVFCSDVFPLEETLLPIFKRKILSYIHQSEKVVRKLLQ
jgi:hypothetical protein